MDSPNSTAAATTDAAIEKNRQYLWNPFTQMQDYFVSDPVVIERAHGVKLIGTDGAEYYDGNASLWVNVHGHHRAELDQAIIDQLENVAHSTLLGMANMPALELAERLVRITPASIGKVFYSDAGAAAVEIGLKMAFAYWRRVGRPEKNVFATFHSAYHGDTFGAMSAGDSRSFHGEFAPFLFPCKRVTYPNAYRFPGSEGDAAAASLREIEALFVDMADQIACLLVEPIVQGAGGIITMPPGFLADVAALCRRHDVLLFADEVATGFGRTGQMFACNHEGVEPDMMAIGKGLTGGYLPMAATLTSDAIYEAFLGEVDELKTFFHGHTYSGNQLACAVALASLDLFERDQVVTHVQESSTTIARHLEKIASLPHVGDTRQRGFAVGIELVDDKPTATPFDWRIGTARQVCRRARELGLITRPLGDVVTLLPPLVSTDDELETMLGIVYRAIADVTGA